MFDDCWALVRRIFEPIIGSDRLPSGKTPQDALAFFTLFPSVFPRLGPQTGSRHTDVFGQSKLANV